MNASKPKIYNIGDIIDLSLCDESIKINDHFLFKINDAWGIANLDGEVIIENKLDYPVNSYFGGIDESLTIVKDINTKLYGVISRNFGTVIIPFEYTYIEAKIVEYPTGIIEKRRVENPFKFEDEEDEILVDYPVMKKELFFLVSKGGYISKEKVGLSYKEIGDNGLWGLYKENGNTLVSVRYYDIQIYNQFIECRSTDEYIINEYESLGNILSQREYIGNIDLYTINGNFIVGGVDLVEYHDEYIKLYKGIEYETKIETKDQENLDGYGYCFDLLYNILKFENSSCLIIDKQFKPVLKARSNWSDSLFHIGMTFNGKEDFCEKLGSEFLLNGCSVDIQFINKGLLFLKYPNEQFIISEFKSETNEVCSINICCDGRSEYIDFPCGKWEDILIEEKTCVIVKLSDDGSVAWAHRVNEIGLDNCYINLFYREGGKTGIFSEKGFGELKYSAISNKLQSNGNLVVAIKETAKTENSLNPNFNQFDNSIIKYYEVNEKEELVKLDDDWNVFDPRKYNWFPDNFKEDNDLFLSNDLFYDGVCYNDNDCVGGWSRRELEDAADAAYEDHSRLELGLE